MRHERIIHEDQPAGEGAFWAAVAAVVVWAFGIGTLLTVVLLVR